MLLPPGQGQSKELNTSYTIFEQLLEDLSTNRFSGYLRISFWGYEGVVVFDTGRIFQAYSSEPESHLIGAGAVIRILKKSEEKEGNIEVYPLASETALALGFALEASPFKNEKVLNRLNLKQLLNYLEVEKITGYTDLQFSGKRGTGTIYFLEGTPVEAVVMSASGKLVSGSQVFTKFLEVGDFIHPMATIYRVSNPHPIIQDHVFLIPWQHEKYIKFWHELFLYFDQLLNRKYLKEGFFPAFKTACLQLSSQISFLNPGSDNLEISREKFLVNHLLPHPQFLEAMEATLSIVLSRVPRRKRRKLKIAQIMQDVQRIADNNSVPQERLRVDLFVYKIFERLA